MVEVVLHEGRKHIVRRLLDAVGYPVEQLVRTAIGDGAGWATSAPARSARSRSPRSVQLYRAVGL